MIGVDEALGIVMEAARAAGPLPAETVPLEQAAARILREAVRADRDMPPFTRSAMDGYALRSDEARTVPAVLEVVEEIPAGREPEREIGAGQAAKIMTGARIPAGADAVQMVEKTRPAGEGRVEILEPVPAGAHIRRAGEDLRRGELLLDDGRLIDAAGMSLLASSGRAQVAVSRRPRVAILPTGDELVPVARTPGPSQIRESNAHTLAELVRQAGGIPCPGPIVEDSREDLRDKIARALESSDVLLLSGGVSMGDYDFVGDILSEQGCEILFDRVAIQPGKPLTFGRAGRILVFGLPGNPVSTYVDFLVFGRPALKRLMGASQPHAPVIRARLAESLSRRPGRRAYLPARLDLSAGEPTVTLIPSMGSADMVAMSRADALAILDENSSRLEAGVKVPVLPLDAWSR